MKKPSERIQEMNHNLPFKGIEVQEGVRQFASYEGAINTIIQYLDEEYKKKQAESHPGQISVENIVKLESFIKSEREKVRQEERERIVEIIKKETVKLYDENEYINTYDIITLINNKQ